MSWSPAFLSALADPQMEPVWLLSFEPYTSGHGGSYVLSSHERGGVKRGIVSVTQGSASVTPGTWRVTAGSWRVVYLGGVSDLVSNVVQGNLARLYMGFKGWATSDYQEIAAGGLSQVSGSHPRYTLEFRDIISQMASRPDPSKMRLFHDIGSTSTTTADYATTDSTLTVGSTTFFDESNGGLFDWVKVDDGSSDPFYLSWTSKTGTVFTVSTTDWLDTVRSAALTGSTVTEVAVLYGNPATILGRVAASTGAASNGSYDVLPETWGWGLPDGMIDGDDLTTWGDVINAGGSAVWYLPADQPIENGSGWLISQLALGGCWPVVRQGQISMRVAQDPGAYIETGYTLTDRDIREVESWTAWDASITESLQASFSWWDTTTPPGFQNTISTSETVLTLPAQYKSSTDLSPIIYSSSNAEADRVRDRLAGWQTRKPERISLRLNGLAYAGLVPGDVVRVTSERIQGRSSFLSTLGGFSNVACMVIQAEVGWMSGYVRLTLVTMPEADR